MKTLQSKYSFALAHSEVRNKLYVYVYKPTYITSHECVKPRLHKRGLIKKVWSNCRPAKKFSVTHGSIQ